MTEERKQLVRPKSKPTSLRECDWNESLALNNAEAEIEEWEHYADQLEAKAAKLEECLKEAEEMLTNHPHAQWPVLAKLGWCERRDELVAKIKGIRDGDVRQAERDTPSAGGSCDA